MQMLLVFLGYMMKFVDINKLQSQRCTAATGGTCINMLCCQHHGQHVAELRKHLSSNSSSTSSGCDSAGSSSSKENFYVHKKLQKQQQQQEQQHSITPQQLQQLHFYQQLQRKQLLLLQKQLLKRRQLQQQQQRVLQQMGVKITNKSVNTSTVPLTCNQQYLLQLRLQQQQQQNVYNNINKIDNICYNDSDVINNNNNNNNNANFKQNDNLFGGVGGFECNESNGFVQGQKFRRGMTEFPTKNDTKQKSHLSQPLQNSPSRHQHNNLNLNTISSQHFASNINNKILINKNSTLQAAAIAAADTKTLANISRKLSATPTSPPTSAQHSPLHYKKLLNSPNNSPFAHAYTRASTISQQQQQQKLQQQQQKLLSVGYNNKPQQQYLNDILAQQQHLQQQQQQLLQVTPNESDERDGELSEESLKQNVAIVLNNLDRYNNALRSIILNEQVKTNSYLEDILVERQEVENNNNNNNNNSNNIISNNNNFLQISGEELIMATAATPESDYNSNATTPGSARCYDNNMLQQHTNMVGCNNGVGNSNNALINAGNIGGGNIMSNNLNCSLASEHDFTHDNSDYQWFLDYGYRDGCNGMQRSVLSSLSASYNTMGDLIYYEDIAKNLDANLAEVDMESFQAQDINSLLWQLPSYCQRLASGNQRLQQSLLLQQQQQQQLQQQQQQQQQQQYLYEQQHKLPQHVSQTSTTSTNELIENSICKSELLFSPVKETHLSVVSLDMENYPDDGDIILTCKANKENYTIAFEGSVLYSDDSYYEPAEITLKNKQNFINLHSNLNEVQRKALDVSMSRSEQVAHNCQNNRMQRYPSGNNNTTETSILPQFSPTHKKVRKSNSLPNLGDLHSEVSLSTSKSKIMCCSSTHSSPKHMPHQATTRQQQAEEEVLRNMLPMCRIPVCCDSMLEENTQPCAQHQIQQIQQGQQQAHYHHHHRHKQQQQQQQQQMTSTATNSSSSGSSHTPAYNLVKMFIKQKSSNNCSIESAEAASAHTCMDISSGCWPSSDAAGSNCSNSSSLEQRLRKKSMHDSGKGSALSKHDEEELAAENCTNSPAKRQAQVMRHPQVSLLAQHNNNNNNNNRSSGGSSYQSSSTSEQMTQMDLGKMQTATPTASQERITRSMQTSCGTLSARSSFSERLRCIPPSFLAKLNNLGESKQAPIYVIYPNYALPDLGFVKTNASAEIIYESFNYKTAMSNAAETQTTSLKKRFSASSELLKQMDYKHVQDWQSLVTLLPAEYRQRLQHIPEVYEALKKLSIGEGQRPLFCMSPPVKRNRQHICDCVQYIDGQTQNNEACGGSSSSGSSQQPSSGYRGSSTLLTDSELDNVTADPLKQMYVYQYDQHRLDSGVECSPKTPTPQVKPRGILRRNNANKRSSMIEGGQQNYKLSKLEKRRSLQEPPYTQTTVCSSEELEEVFEDEELYTTPKSRKERLSRRDADALARARAENFLSSVPRGELKYYAEIAAILESTEGQSQIPYDAAALKKEVSHLLSQQKKVSFNDETVHKTQPTIFNAETQKRFSTPPNSPNISMANGHNALKTQNGNSSAVKRYSTAAKPATLDAKQQLKLENNRFKRLQIQWELMSKDSSMLKELAAEHQTKSGGSTPTAGPTANKSRIPRPVSYPAGKIHEQEGKGNHARSPSRIVPPKRYGNTTPTSATQVSPLSPVTPTIANRSRTPTSRTPLTAPNTPKRQVPAPRLTSRPR